MEKYQWKNRVLVIKHPDRDTADDVSKRFLNYREELIERDLLVFVCSAEYCVNSKGEQTDFPAERYEEGVTLIGKDGGVKYQGELGTQVSYILDLIDRMPMRRAEMRRKGRY